MGLFKFKKNKQKTVKKVDFETELINHLNEHAFNNSVPVQLLLPENIDTLNLKTEWKTILSTPLRSERVKQTISFWQRNVPEFKMVISEFKKKLISIDTILYKQKICVIYTLKVKNGNYYYLGNMPGVKNNNMVIEKLPDPLKTFYLKVHDGFIMYDLEDMGPAPSNSFYCLGDDLLPEEFIEGYSVKDCYMIFSNGGGDGIVYDLSKNPPKGFIYYHDDYENSDFDCDPIATIDSWINMALNSE